MIQHIAPQVLAWMGATGDLVRGHNGSHWRVNRNLWARMDDWLDETWHGRLSVFISSSMCVMRSGGKYVRLPERMIVSKQSQLNCMSERT
jgi:hypothetical protein